jgi:hypothetical protein
MSQVREQHGATTQGEWKNRDNHGIYVKGIAMPAEQN